MIDKINIGLITATAGAVVYMFTSFASAADVERIEARLIKQELRELRAELREVQDPAYREAILEDIQEAIDDLCIIKPEDRECK